MLLVLASCFSLALSAALSPALAGVTERVSVSTGGEQGNGQSIHPAVSADGRYVAFGSYASNLVPGGTNGYADVFARDRLAGTTELVSVSSSGGQGDYGSGGMAPSISADGRYVAFVSEASNLVPGDTNAHQDIFVRDRLAGATMRVSVSSSGEQGDNDSRFASISGDGRYVAFHSYASNLVPGDTNGTWDVFVRDRVLGVTERVSVSTGGEQTNGQSYYPSISGDGRYVAFQSDASNLVPGDTNGCFDVFVRDRLSGTTERVSVSSAEEQGNWHSQLPCISADGRYVAFHSSATNLVPGDTNVSPYGDPLPDVFVRDRAAGLTELVSVSTGGQQGNGGSGYPGLSVSADGRYVAFDSEATNLVPGDTNGTWDIFVRDRLLGTTERVSVSTGGEQGNDYSGGYAVSISADGRYVAFASYASNLVPGDTNGTWDVFVRDRWGSESSPDIPITEFTLTPETLGPGSDVTARVVAPGAVSSSLRITGLTRDNPAIATHWDGTAWTATINGSLAAWAAGDTLLVWADVSDGQGRSGTACRVLAVAHAQPPQNTGDPNAVWVDESNARGILTGKVKEAPISGTTPPPLRARLSMDTVVTSLLGADGSMTIWPEVTSSGVHADPAADYSLGAVLARLGLFSPSGGPAYDVTFNEVGDKAIFSAHFGAKSLGLTVWDLVAQVAAAAADAPVPSAADLAETYAAFAELAPVKSALGHFDPWPSNWKLPGAASLAAWDLSELARNAYERATLKTILERLLHKKIGGSAWLKAVEALLAPYNMLKILRDEAVWGVQTADGDPVIVFTAWHSGAGLMSAGDGGGTGLVRPAGIDVSFDLAESPGNDAYNFTLKNVEGAALWEWRVGLDGDQPQPTAVSAPLGWKSDIVWSMDERCVRFRTEGPNGWAAGDFGGSVIPEGGSLSGFSFTLPYRLQQCSFTATGTDQRIDGGMLSMVPALSAAPPDFAPTEGETTQLLAYLDRPAAASIKIFSGGAEFLTVAADQAEPAGGFTATWNGTGPDGQPAAPGQYEARLHVVYPDGSTADLSTPLTIVTGLMVDSIGELSSLPPGRQVRLVGKAVTMGTSGSPAFIYVEERDRSAGVKVMTSQTASEGDVVNVSGTVSSVDGERAITSAVLESVSTGGSPPGPLGLPTNRLGGTGSGVSGSAGLYNIGLLLRAAGKVTQIGTDYLYINDGSNLKDGTMRGADENVGVRVICDPAGYAPGDFLTVTGISSCFETPSGDIARRILTRRAEDVSKLAP
jgi:Tol biopolymer transport system component